MSRARQGAGSGPALAGIFLLVRDPARARAFYEALLGRAPEKAGGAEVRFRLADGAALTLHADLAEAERARWRVLPEPASRGWGVYLTLQGLDPDRGADRARGAGGTVVLAPQDAPWGGRFCVVADPDGYTIELSAPQ